jgi:small subunit ribosomal protein S4e
MSGHLHRIAAPRNYPILKKTAHYIIKVTCGPHPKKSSLPLLVFLRDLLGITHNYAETKKMLNSGKVMVDQVVRKDPKFPIGLMDVVSIPDIGKNYRIIFLKGPKVGAVEIPEKESREKLCKIMNRVIVNKGKIQINLNDGRNMLVDKKELKPGDSILVTLPDVKIQKHLNFENGALVYITDGKHIGEMAKMMGIKPMVGSNPDRVILVNKKGENFETLKRYIFVVGKEKPELKISQE